MNNCKRIASIFKNCVSKHFYLKNINFCDIKENNFWQYLDDLIGLGRSRGFLLLRNLPWDWFFLLQAREESLIFPFSLSKIFIVIKHADAVINFTWTLIFQANVNYFEGSFNSRQLSRMKFKLNIVYIFYHSNYH